MAGTQRRLTNEEYAEIRRLAEIAALNPDRNPVVAGIGGLMLAWFIVFVLIELFGSALQEVAAARLMLLACVIGFLIGYSTIAMKQRAHQKYYLSLLSAKKFLVEGDR